MADSTRPRPATGSVPTRAAVSAQHASAGQPTATQPTPGPVHAAPAAFRYTATAYCQRGTTQSGVDTRAGVAAADPDVLPVGSVVHIDARAQKYDGVYTVLDTGSKVQGRLVDLFIRDCQEAQQFGRQAVRVKVLRKGWSPKATQPGIGS